MQIVMVAIFMSGFNPILNCIGNGKICLRICKISLLNMLFNLLYVINYLANWLKKTINIKNKLLIWYSKINPLYRLRLLMLAWLFILIRIRKRLLGIFWRRLSKAIPHSVPEWFTILVSKEMLTSKIRKNSDINILMI